MTLESYSTQYWVTADGQKLHPSAMSSNHLINCITLAMRKTPFRNWSELHSMPIIDAMYKELNRRECEQCDIPQPSRPPVPRYFDAEKSQLDALYKLRDWDLPQASTNLSPSEYEETYAQISEDIRELEQKQRKYDSHPAFREWSADEYTGHDVYTALSFEQAEG